MIRALIEGILLGITIAFLIGPAFISLIQTSIYRGLVSGIQFAFGILISDVAFIAISYLGTMKILGGAEKNLPLGIIGGLILITFGYITFSRKTKLSTEQSRIKVPFSPHNIFKYVFKGFFINIFNPFLLIFWVGVVGLVSSKYGISSNETIMFFSGTLIAVFCTDVFKCIIANKIRNILNFKVLSWLNMTVGIMLILFGLVLIIRVILLN